MNLQVGSPTPSSYARVLYWDTTLHDDHQAKKLLAPYIDPESASDLSCCDPAPETSKLHQLCIKGAWGTMELRPWRPPKKRGETNTGIASGGGPGTSEALCFWVWLFFSVVQGGLSPVRVGVEGFLGFQQGAVSCSGDLSVSAFGRVYWTPRRSCCLPVDVRKLAGLRKSYPLQEM